MSQVNGPSAAVNIHPGAHLQPALSQEVPAFAGLPSPLMDASEPTDALGMMMMAMERMAQASINQKQLKIENTQAKLDDAMEELMDHLMEATKKASDSAKKDRGGIFGAISGFIDDVVDAVAGFVGKVAGTVIDFAEDAVMGPLDMMVGVLKNLQNPEKWGQIFKDELKQLYTNGDTAKKFEGAVKGVVKFAVDALEFAHSSIAAMEAGLRGKNILDAMGDELVALKDSFTSNLIDNPDFMAVLGDVAKAAAIAATAVSGGTLAPFAVGLIIAADLDSRHGLATAIAGEEAGPWISAGLSLAATVAVAAATLGAGASGGSETLQWLNKGTALLGAASQAYSGIKAYQQANTDADHIESMADMLKIQNRMSQLQRLMTELLGELEQSTEARTDIQEMGKHIAGVQASTNQAAIFRA